MVENILKYAYTVPASIQAGMTYTLRDGCFTRQCVAQTLGAEIIYRQLIHILHSLKIRKINTLLIVGCLILKLE